MFLKVLTVKSSRRSKDSSLYILPIFNQKAIVYINWQTAAILLLSSLNMVSTNLLESTYYVSKEQVSICQSKGLVRSCLQCVTP